MKTLYISVPQWYPASPYLACALLAGQLNAAGYPTDTLDLNISFFNDILTKDYVTESFSLAKQRFAEESPLLPEGIPAGLAEKIKTAFTARKRIIGENLDTDWEKTAGSVDHSVKVMKTKELFYDPEQLFAAKDVLKDALEIVSLPWAPSRIMLDNYIANPAFSYDFPDVDFQCKSHDVNMFLPYFEKKLDSLNLSGYSLIGISVTDLSQVVPGMTLARLLKQRTDAKICLGGNYIYKIKPNLMHIPAVFREYCDYLNIGDGEISSIELAEMICGKRDIRDVHSLVYLDEAGTIRENEAAPLLHLDEVAYPDFDSYDFSQYFSPETVIPVQLGKGCYWGKCSFCDFYTGQQKFDMKTVHRAVDEVEYLSQKYHSGLFNFVDEAVPPKFYNEFAKEIKRRGLSITFYSFARLEKAFTPEVLKNLYEGGARFFMWGYEAESPRVMKLINKGIDVTFRKKILRDAADAGLWNLCTFLLCYPTETAEELQSTIDVIYDHELVNTCTPSNFALKKNAILKNDAGSVGITQFNENGELHISYKYESTVTTMEEIKRKRNSFERQYLKDTADRLWAHTFTDSDYLLMYLTRYGRDYVKNYRLRYRR